MRGVEPQHPGRARALLRLGALCVLLLGTLLPSLTPRRTQAGEGGEGERILAIYLPGVYFAQLENKVELGHELANYIAAQMGDRFRLTPRVYAALDALDADAGRVVLGLLEAPLVAARLSSLQPVQVAIAGAGGSSEARLQVLASSNIKSLADLRASKLHYALAMDSPLSFFENVLFEGELPLARDRLVSARDVSSLLSLASLRKADAIVLYEDDAAQAQKAGLRPLFTGGSLPRPTLVVFDRRVAAADVARLRDVMTGFKSASQPSLRSFRATGEAPYQTLRGRAERRPRRLPPLLELDEDAAPLPLPHAPSAPPRVPITTYAPEVD